MSSSTSALTKSKVSKGLPRVVQPYSTFKHEMNLPRLPVPPLQQSMEKYLASVKPILAENEIECTKAVVDDFRKPGGVGEELQDKLVARFNKHDNWLAEWWDDVAYFGYQNPVVVYSSPGIAFPKQYFAAKIDQIRYCAKAIRAVLGFKGLIDSESLPPDMQGNDPLTMFQYNKVLSTCRIPHHLKDFAITTPAHQSRHVTVMCHDQAFELVVYKNNEPLSEEELVDDLIAIDKMASKEQGFLPVGILTSTDRRTWGKTYKLLKKDSVNNKSLEKIIKSIFVLCLDKPCGPRSNKSSTGEDPVMTMNVNHALHGRGTSQNSCNRWFDQVFQLAVSEDGYVGCCYEHSSAEGPPIQLLCNHILSRCSLEDTHTHYEPSESRQPNRLQWRLSNELEDKIQEAKDAMDQLVDDVDMKMIRYRSYGKNFPKANKISPDAFIQVGLQLAYFRLHENLAATYESASTRKFRRGRTDTIRSASIPVKEFCQAMASNDYGDSERKELFLKAVHHHVKYTKEATNGQAIDRHLLGLKLICMESGIKLPEFFRDKGYNYSLHHKLSTSQVPSPYDTVLCFGPTVPDGYGVCYNPMEKHFNFAVSAFNSNPETSSARFAESLKTSFDDIRRLFHKSKL
eukprot:gene15982-17592_t